MNRDSKPIYDISRTVRNHFLFIALPGLLFLVGVLFLIYNRENRNHREQLARHEAFDLEIISEIIIHRFINISTDLRYLGGAAQLFANNEIAAEALITEFSLFAETKEQYHRISYLDNDGREMVRVDFFGDFVHVTPPEDLQDQSHRYYVQEILSQEPEEIYISPLDNGADNANLEIPFRPTVHFGLQSRNAFGKLHGLVVLSYSIEGVLSHLEYKGRYGRGRLMLLDEYGHELLGLIDEGGEEYAIHTDEFESKFPEHFHVESFRHFMDDYPDVWPLLNDAVANHFFGDEGLFTFRAVWPVQNYRWTVVSFLPGEFLRIDDRGFLLNLFLVGVCGFFLLSLFSWTIARFIVGSRIRSQALYRSANYDSLTGLPNRLLFFDRLNQILYYSLRYNREGAVLFIDLDGFKAVNDNYGHGTGDALLKQVAQRLTESIRRSDTVARIGGDEFIVLLGECSKTSEAEWVGRKILVSLEKPYYVLNHEVVVGASMGIRLFRGGNDAQTILQDADKAMYEAKKSGKTQYRIMMADAGL